VETGALLKMISLRKHPCLHFNYPYDFNFRLFINFCCSYIRTSEEPTTEVEKSPVAEKQGGEDETPEAKKELTAEEKAQKEAEEAEARVQSFTALETSFEV